MWIDPLRAAIGAAQSVVAPMRAGTTRRLERHIDVLAEKRGVPSWFRRFTPHRLETATGQLHIDMIEVESPCGSFVFMPGTNAYTLLYGEFLTAVADLGWSVFSFDPRGHGRSSGKRGSYTIEELIEDYADVLGFVRSRGSGPLVISGSSQGGITAFYAALGDPAVDGVVCHNLADLSDPRAGQLTRFGESSSAVRPMVDALARVAPEFPVPMQMYLDLRREPVRGYRNAHQILLEDPLIPWFVRAKTLASLGSAAPPSPFEEFDRPLLVLQAGADTIFPTDYIRELAARIPTAQLEVFDHLPHYMIVDHVQTLLPPLTTWLGDMRPP